MDELYDYGVDHGMNNIICNLSSNDMDKILKIINSQEITKNIILPWTYDFNHTRDLLQFCKLNKNDLYKYYLNSNDEYDYFRHWSYPPYYHGCNKIMICSVIY